MPPSEATPGLPAPPHDKGIVVFIVEVFGSERRYFSDRIRIFLKSRERIDFVRASGARGRIG